MRYAGAATFFVFERRDRVEHIQLVARDTQANL
jgi:hypothetical protein